MSEITSSASRRKRTRQWVTHLPFWAVHLACLVALYTGAKWWDVALCAGLYWVRMFGITAGYHRYFSHRAYKTSRWFQFVLAWLGASASQKGPLWWAANHRVHHRYSDQPEDVHSPLQRGFWHSHVGWILSDEHEATNYKLVPDLARYPELVWLNKHWYAPPLALAAACFALGGLRGVVWGFCVSTVLCWHCTFFVNSLAHVWGSRRYPTSDTSRNNPLIAFLTMGEGWHNNHHHYMNSANQGFFWWEFDVSYYILRAFSAVGLVSDLRRPPRHVLEEGFARAGRLAEVKIAQAREAVAEVRIAAEGHIAEAEARLVEARQAAEAMIAEARQAAEARIAEARQAAEARIAEAETALADARQNAGVRFAEVRSAVSNAVDEAVDAASGINSSGKTQVV